MTQRRRDTKAILRTVARSERRSPLFRWMVEHHDELVEASRPDGIHWASFCEQSAKRGLTDTRGLAPNPANARKTWAQARKAVATARAAAKPPRPKPPSRFPKDWSPTVLSEQEIPVPAYLRPPGLTAANPAPPALSRPPATIARQAGGYPPSQFVKPEDPPEIQEMMRGLEEDLHKADRWMGGGPIKRRTE